MTGPVPAPRWPLTHRGPRQPLARRSLATFATDIYKEAGGVRAAARCTHPRSPVPRNASPRARAAGPRRGHMPRSRVQTVPNYINGKFVPSKSTEHLDLTNPVRLPRASRRRGRFQRR